MIFWRTHAPDPQPERTADAINARDLLPPGDDSTPLYRECLDAR